MELKVGTVAVVTGGTSGLGYAVARSLAGLGVKVAIFGRDETKGESAATEVGGIFCRADVSSPDQVAAAFAKARRAHGQEQVLVNCAGASFPSKTAWRDRATGETRAHSIEIFESLLAINLIGTFNCIALSAQGMLSDVEPQDGERGVIINTASIGAQDGQAGQAAYAAAKAGIASMTLPIARDLAGEGIRVNTVLPGVFDTPLFAFASSSASQKLIESVLWPQRLGEPAEFASLVLEICRNRYVNAATLRVDGGARMPPR